MLQPMYLLLRFTMVFVVLKKLAHFATQYVQNQCVILCCNVSIRYQQLCAEQGLYCDCSAIPTTPSHVQQQPPQTSNNVWGHIWWL